uniref:Uncharacterized protein n=1 Tax=Tetranychus urticae TaxID=32264 RepID=T1KYU2_TETUR
MNQLDLKKDGIDLIAITVDGYNSNCGQGCGHPDRG